MAPESPSRIPCPFCGELIVASAVKCRFCNEAVGKAAKVPPKARKGGFFDGLFKLIAAGFIVFFVIVLWQAATGHPSVPVPPVPPAAAPEPVAELGPPGYRIEASSSQGALICVRDADWKVMVQTELAHDVDEMQKLMAEGRVGLLPNGTRVRILERGWTSRKVETLDEPIRGITGWVAEEDVKGREP